MLRMEGMNTMKQSTKFLMILGRDHASHVCIVLVLLHQHTHVCLYASMMRPHVSVQRDHDALRGQHQTKVLMMNDQPQVNHLTRHSVMENCHRCLETLQRVSFVLGRHGA